MNVPRLKSVAAGAALALLALVGASCGGAGTDQPDCDYLMTVGVPSGTAIDPFDDRRCPGFHAINFDVNVAFRAAIPAIGGSSVYDQFRVTHYSVQYVNRNTGGNVPGVDVPLPFSFVTPFEPQIVPTTFSFGGWPILTEGAKVSPPLSNPSFFLQGSVEFLAVITVFGHPADDPDKACSGSFLYEFNVCDGCICV